MAALLLMLSSAPATSPRLATHVGRRSMVVSATGAMLAHRPPLTAAEPTPEFLEAERLRAERQKRLAEGRKAFEKRLKAVSFSASVDDFESATDNLSLYIISNGIPEGVQIKDVVTKVRLAYLDYDTPCTDKRLVCEGPRSRRAEAAYNAFLKELQKRAPAPAGAPPAS
ncbi:hypothetical protein AB1Y20_014540 [Prymnesium parvum]|uniref:Uncharacterized protein n=1 Tax=Prymnesium parvum TaxID=97485 RepID=A0AB34IB38_PRYPA